MSYSITKAEYVLNLCETFRLTQSEGIVQDIAQQQDSSGNSDLLHGVKRGFEFALNRGHPIPIGPRIPYHPLKPTILGVRG